MSMTLREFIDREDAEELRLKDAVKAAKQALATRPGLRGSLADWYAEAEPLRQAVREAEDRLAAFDRSHRHLEFLVATAPRPTQEQARRLALLLSGAV